MAVSIKVRKGNGQCLNCGLTSVVGTPLLKGTIKLLDCARCKQPQVAVLVWATVTVS